MRGSVAIPNLLFELEALTVPDLERLKDSVRTAHEAVPSRLANRGVGYRHRVGMFRMAPDSEFVWVDVQGSAPSPYEVSIGFVEIGQKKVTVQGERIADLSTRVRKTALAQAATGL